MQNAAVAQIFEEIADYLELAGDNPFKIRAYRKASDAILSLESPIENMAEGDALEAVEGLGSATIAKTREFLATGSVRLLDKLKGEYPPGLLEVLRVPGLGPRKVALLYKERQIDSLESLVLAIDEGRLDGLSGFGPKTIANLRSGISRLAALSTRLPMSAATTLAERLCSALQTETTRVEVAGSLRRGRDTVGNLNLVAGTPEGAALLERFCNLPLVLEVLQREPHRALVRMAPGLEVELVCTPPENLGWLLVERTGSAAHLDQLKSKLPASPRYQTEEEVYRAAGLSWIPPELREARDEFLLAAQGEVPVLVEEGQIRGDLHCHSNWSDGAASIEGMAQAAVEQGYEYLAITDHSRALAMTNGLNAARLREQALEIARVQQNFPTCKILRGIECDIMRDGSLDLEDDILGELDFVVASVHSGFNLPGPQQTERMLRALRHPSVRLIAHPTGRVLGVRPPYEVDVAQLIQCARDYGKALEINSSERLDLDDEHARLARLAGVPLAINTDSHSPRMLANIRYGVKTARRAGCAAPDVLNCKTWPELRDWLGMERPL